MVKKIEETKVEKPVETHDLLGDEADKIDLHELQIKLERVRSYVKRTEMRITANELNLQRLREKQQEVEGKRLGITMVKKNKTENKV